MRKTSQDGADSTSITSGLDNELKKAGTSTTNKIKKTSIKRKVPNFSHDSDDAIIEPLLQTEKENAIIANKSAKYLLNKSKTESLYEKDTKTLENPKVSSPVGISNNITTNIIMEKQASPSLISETPPIYNHMNTNVFSGYDLTKEKTTTSNSILVEIDGCKTVTHGSSPLVLTTAKIHTDNNKKVPEPVQVTPVPILSTIEGNIVKSGVVYEDNKRYSILQSNKCDMSTNSNIKSDLKIKPSNSNDLSHVNVLPSVASSSSVHIKNQQNITKELHSTDPSEKSVKLFSKDQKVSLPMSSVNIQRNSSMSKVISNEPVTTKAPSNIETVKSKTNGVISDMSKQLIGPSSKSIMTDKNYISEKAKPLSDIDTMNVNKISQPSASSSKQNTKSNANVIQHDKIDNNIKSFSSNSKKLQRQKNASTDEMKETSNKDLNNIIKEKTAAGINKGVSTPIPLKSDTQKTSPPMTTTTTTISELPSKSLSSSVINPSICKSPLINVGTTLPLNGKSSIEIAKTQSAPTKIPEPSGKSSTKPLATVTTTVMTTATSTKTSTSFSAKSVKVIEDKPSLKQDTTSVSIFPSKITKTEPTTTSPVATTLPLYIVSTSKTKIGSTSTSSISTVTKKTLDQKPITEVVSTANGKSGKVLMSTSSTQNNQSSSKPKITSGNAVKKDDRA